MTGSNKRTILGNIVLFYSFLIVEISMITAYIDGSQTIKNEFRVAGIAVVLFAILIWMNWPDKEFIKKLEEVKIFSDEKENKTDHN